MQEFFEGSPYRRTPQRSASPAVAWIFDGVEADNVRRHSGCREAARQGFELDPRSRSASALQPDAVVARPFRRSRPELPGRTRGHPELTMAVGGKGRKIEAHMLSYGCI